MAKIYAARFRCPCGDADKILILRNRNETIEQIQLIARHFDCPVHGVQLERPVEAREIMDASSLGTNPIEVAGGSAHKYQRRSKRIALQIRVRVHGRVGKSALFQEETSTQMVSAHGGSLALTTPVRVGETLRVVNLATQNEEKCRIASVEPLGGVSKVGLAFLQSAPNFWGLDFPLHRQ